MTLQQLKYVTFPAHPLQVDEIMCIGVIMQKNMPLSRYGKTYVEALKKHVSVYVN